MGILIESVQTLEFWPNPSKYWNSHLIPLNTEILTVFFYTLEFWTYPFKRWNSDLILPITGILSTSFQTSEFWPNPSQHWNSDHILPNTGILVLSFETLEFLPYPSETVEFRQWSYPSQILSYPSKQWNSDLILSNFRILTYPFKHCNSETFEFWSYPSKLGMLALFFQTPFQTLKIRPYPTKHWNSGLIFSNIGIVFFAF